MTDDTLSTVIAAKKVLGPEKQKESHTGGPRQVPVLCSRCQRQVGHGFSERKGRENSDPMRTGLVAVSRARDLSHPATVHLLGAASRRQAIAMDYDKSDIASIYDEARTLTPERLGQWLDLLSTHIDRNAISLIIDLGCGTGRFSEPLAAHFGVRVIATALASDAGSGSPQARERQRSFAPRIGTSAAILGQQCGRSVHVDGLPSFR